MTIDQFKHLYNVLFEQKQDQKGRDTFIIEFDIQETKFAYFRGQDKKYKCKFNFQFLDQTQQVTVLFKGDNQLEFKVDDPEEEEEIYDKKKFKEYFHPQYQLFKQSFDKFKEYLSNNKKIKEEKNQLTIIPLDVLMKRQQDKQQLLNIDGVAFNINEIKNTFKDMYRVDFEITQAQSITTQRFITAIYKVIASQNYYIIDVYLSKEDNELKDATKITKDQFASKYPNYFDKLNKAIKTYLSMNN